MFTLYETKRVKKAPGELVAGKNWQPGSRRLYLPLDGAKYGLKIHKKEGRGHSVEWAKKPYARLYLGDGKSAIAKLEVNNMQGIAIQVDPSNTGRFYVSIPKGARGVFPEEACDVSIKKDKAGAFIVTK